MANDNHTSVDEFLERRKQFVRDDGSVVKAVKSGGPKTWDPKARTVEFIMSAEVEDRDRDIIKQAGLNIDSFIGENPVALPMHNHRALPIGKWSDVTKNLTGRPRRTEGKLHLIKEGVSNVADEIAAHFDFGSLKACSIGFIPTKVKRRDVPEDKKNEDYFWPGYEIEESELLECSVVNIPANPAALAKHAALGNTYAKEMIEEVLDNWAKHPETGLLIPRSEFEDAWHKATGERTTFTADYGLAEKSVLQTVGSFFGLVPKTTEQIATGEGAGGLTLDEEAFLADQKKADEDKLNALKQTVEDAVRRREVRMRAEALVKRVA